MEKQEFHAVEGLQVQKPEKKVNITDIKGELSSELVNNDVYEISSPIVSYIESRLNILCGDKIKKPELFVRKNPSSKNAFAMPGLIVVDDGILDLIESQEELDGLLAHELIHITRQHSEKRQKNSRNDPGNVGIIRASEIESDVLAMHLLDERGINPAGMINRPNDH